MADQQFCLRWNNHQSTLISVFDSLQERGCMVDCTLAAEGQSLQAHKVVLSACSPYLEDLLSKHYDKHPILLLKDVKYEELRAMLDYMYRGEVNVAQDKLNSFLKAAESLQIKGLSDGGTDPPDSGGTSGVKRTSKGAPISVRSNQLSVRSTNLNEESLRDGSVSPSLRKRRRRRGSEGSDHDSSCNVLDGKQSSAAAPVSGPSIINQDLLPTVPTSGNADANLLLSSIMESAETENVTDSGVSSATNVVPLNSQDNIVIGDKDSDVLVEPKTEYLDDDAQDLHMEDDGMFGAGPSHARASGHLVGGGVEDFMTGQDSGASAQGEIIEVENLTPSLAVSVSGSMSPVRIPSSTASFLNSPSKTTQFLRQLGVDEAPLCRDLGAGEQLSVLNDNAGQNDHLINSFRMPEYIIPQYGELVDSGADPLALHHANGVLQSITVAEINATEITDVDEVAGVAVEQLERYLFNADGDQEGDVERVDRAEIPDEARERSSSRACVDSSSRACRRCERCRDVVFVNETESQRSPHEGRNYVCDLCGERFASVIMLDQHSRETHTTPPTPPTPPPPSTPPPPPPPRPPTPPLSPVERKPTLPCIKKTAINFEEKNYSCHLCDRRFGRKKALEAHVSWHRDTRGYSATDLRFKLERTNSFKAQGSERLTADCNVPLERIDARRHSLPAPASSSANLPAPSLRSTRRSGPASRSSSALPAPQAAPKDQAPRLVNEEVDSDTVHPTRKSLRLSQQRLNPFSVMLLN